MMYARKRIATITLPISNILFRSTATSLKPNRNITRQHPESVPFWIDMEGAIRTDDVFDVGKCRRVCEIVFR
jgi:hypothetical protein